MTAASGQRLLEIEAALLQAVQAVLLLAEVSVALLLVEVEVEELLLAEFLMVAAASAGIPAMAVASADSSCECDGRACTMKKKSVLLRTLDAWQLSSYVCSLHVLKSLAGYS